ncbi:MAG: hypothetical protein EHM79_02220 [Geobacter sp.]|nr:MAG: hypothetical protein EHM79_02220 [Geobacter sp.]
MAIATEYTLNYTTKTINHVSGTTRYTVQELYSHIMDLLDDAANMDDTVPIKANTPTEFELINGWTFGADSDLGYLKGGSIVDTTTDDIWANFYTLGTIAAGSLVYWMQNGVLVTNEPTYVSGHIDQLVKVTDAGTDVDSKKITAFIRNLGDTYDHFEVTATATGGRNPIPLATGNDLNDDADSEAGDFTGATINFASISRDTGTGAHTYGIEVDLTSCATTTAAHAYKYIKFLTNRLNDSALDTSIEQGRFFQKLAAASSTIKASPLGTFAGGKLFGAAGVWFAGISDTANLELTDTAGTTGITYPVSFAVTVSGVVSGDQVLVARATGDPLAINKSQFTIASVTSNSITATADIAADITQAGKIRIGDVQYEYTSWATRTFSGVTPDPTGKTGGFYVPLIDQVALSTSVSKTGIIYVAPFSVIARVRKKGILPFENSALVEGANTTIAAIRTTDAIAV